MVSKATLPGVAPPEATHELRITAHVFDGSRWDAAQAGSALAGAAQIFAQCAFAVSAELQVLRAPRRLHYLFTPDSRELVRELAPPRPAVFFVEDTRNRPAYDAEAVGRGNSRTRPEMVNTVWITFGTPDLPVALAHELAHVLADSGEHSSVAGNLMNERTAPGNTGLSEAQCDALRSRGVSNGLVVPRVVKP